MLAFRQITLAALGTAAAFSLVACSDGNATGSGGGGSTGTTTDTTTDTGSGAGGGSSTTDTGSGAGGGEPQGKSRGFFFSADTAANTWTVTIVDPTAAEPVIATLAADDLAALTGPAGNDKGPAWGDAIASPDGKRVFANASNADRTLVIETATPSIETLLKVGGKPLHIYNPNDNGEIWTHNDTDGSFSVIDIGTLAVSEPVTASLKGTGHGKLVYGQPLGTRYFATNTNDPGGFAVDGVTHEATFIGLCAVPCEDDPATPADESLNKCGGTHDKTYNPKINQVIFQCSGVTAGTVAYVDAESNAVVKDLVPNVLGGFARTHDEKYILAFDNTTDAVNVWDTEAPGHDGIAFDATATIPGGASVRGTSFHENAMGEAEAWIPQSTGTKLVVLNLVTMAQAEIEIGALSPPPGASSVTRRGEVAGGWYYTNNDSGIVMVNVETRAVVQGPQPAGVIQRINGALVP